MHEIILVHYSVFGTAIPAEVSDSFSGFVENSKSVHGSSSAITLANDSRVNNQDNTRHAGGSSSFRAGTPPQQTQPQQAPPARNQPISHPTDSQGQGETAFQQPASHQQPENTDKSRQFPSLMQLSEQQLYKYRERMMGNPGLVSPYHRVKRILHRLIICLFTISRLTFIRYHPFSRSLRPWTG